MTPFGAGETALSDSMSYPVVRGVKSCGRVETNLARGIAPAEARRQARLVFGNIALGSIW
jgi:hypothetical protein